MIIPKRRIFTLAGGVLLIFSLLAVFSNHSTTSVSSISQRLPKVKFQRSYQRVNATFIVLAQNKDLNDLASTITSYEARFNHKYGYNWVFLNDKPFDEEFKQIISSIVAGEAQFGTLPVDMWSLPPWITKEMAEKSFAEQLDRGSSRADQESYHHMCRFESGFFFKHPLMKNYKYYWRVEPGTKLLCDIDFDVFKYMSDNKLRYSFTIATWEQSITVETLWNTTLRWINENPEYVHSNNLARVVTDRKAEKYNLCQFWSNFEIADADFWREEAYSSYFEFLDRSGGFFLERWGDAPVHTIAAALLLDKNEVTHLDFVGYEHSPLSRTPANFLERELKCATTERKLGSEFGGFSCGYAYFNALNLNSLLPNGMNPGHDY